LLALRGDSQHFLHGGQPGSDLLRAGQAQAAHAVLEGGAAQGKQFSIGGHLIDTTAPLPWVIALAALVLGGLWLRHEARGFRERWDALMEGAKIQDGVKIQGVKVQEAMS
jgi:hypothetical protein